MTLPISPSRPRPVQPQSEAPRSKTPPPVEKKPAAVSAQRVAAYASVQGAKRTVSRGMERVLSDRFNSCIIPPKQQQVNADTQGKGGKSVTAPAAATPTSPAAQAKLDSAQVQSAYDTAKQTGQTDEVASNAAAQKLRDLTNQNSDPAYVNSLLRESSPTLDKIAATAGRNAAEGQGSDNDKDRMKDSLRALSDVTAKAGPVGAYYVGDKLAKACPNSGELHQFDDAFYDNAKNGGSPLLMQATYSALQAQGKGDSADKLVHPGGGGGILGTITGALGDIAGGIVDGAKGIFGAAKDAAGDVINGVVNVAEKGASLAVDAVKGTVDFAGDVAKAGVEDIKTAAEYAAKNGLKLADGLLTRAHDLLHDGLDSALHVGDHIKDLKPGDEYTLSAGGSAALGIGAAVDTSVQVQRQADGSYSVSADMKADLCLGLGKALGGQVGVDAKGTYHFDNADDAKRAALTLATQEAGTLAGPIIGPALAPTPSETDFLSQHLSSLELKGDAAVGVSGLFNKVGDKSTGFNASLDAESGYRVDFANGKPTDLVKVTEATAQGRGGIAGLAMQGLSPQMQQQEPYKSIIEGGDAKGKITIETKLPLDASKIGDLASVITDPLSLPVGSARSKITLEG